MRATKSKKLKIQINGTTASENQGNFSGFPFENQWNAFKEQHLKVNLKRIPFEERTNILNMNKNDLDSARNLRPCNVYIEKMRNVKESGVNSKQFQEHKFCCGLRKSHLTENHNANFLSKELLVILNRIDFNKCVQKDSIKRTEQRKERTPLVNRLRKAERKNYLEESEISLKENRVSVNAFSQPRVPIYKQVVDTKKETKKMDPYELDISDSDKEQKLVKKKIRKREPSDVFNKTMYQVLQKLERKKTTKENTNSKKKIVKKKNYDKYEKNVQDALQRIIEKKNLTKSPKGSQLKKTETILTSNVVPQKPVPLSPFEKATVTSKVVKDDTDVFDTLKSSKPNKTAKMFRKAVDVFDTIKSPNIVHIQGSVPPFSDSNDIAPVFENSISPSPVQNYDDDYDDDDDDGQNNSDDKYFGFKDDENGPESRVIILSDVLLNKSKKSPILIGGKRPNANSTMIRTNKTPWRIPIQNSSNYLLHYKKDSMPCLEQDAIVDHRLVEDIEKHCSNHQTQQTSRKSFSQSSILNYINSPQHSYETNQENIREASLYDYEEFHIATCKPVPRTRKVLGVINEQNQIESTPVKHVQKEIQSPDISIIAKSGSPRISDSSSVISESSLLKSNENKTYFGFESTVTKTSLASNRASVAKPFRIGTEVRRYKKQVQNKNVEEVSAIEDLPSIHNDEQGYDSENGEETRETQLFDDAEPELLVPLDDIPSYGFNADVSDDEEKPKRKKKDAMKMTKAEKEKFEKWASEFNAMCEEIDKHELEIE